MDQKAEYFQTILVEKYHTFFQIKSMKFSNDDKPWYSSELKNLSRTKQREFNRHHKSQKWQLLDHQYKELIKLEKAKYYDNIVKDLKKSDPQKWYSKLKRMSGKQTQNTDFSLIDEFQNIKVEDQADTIVNFYSQTRNLFDPVLREDFPDFYNGNTHLEPSTLFIQPSKVSEVLKSINRNAATVSNDIPIKLFVEFSYELSLPLTHIINSMFEQQIYPQLWKKEMITPVPKVNGTVTAIKELRPISCLLSCARVADKILSEYILSDMGVHFDRQQYGNHNGMSINHLLINPISVGV